MTESPAYCPTANGMALILVIDDMSTMRHLVRRMLQGTDYGIIEAEDGVVGLTQFRQHHPELVITDLVMPNKEGIETIQEIRRSSPDTKIIAMSGSVSASSNLYLNAAGKLGADAVLAKPFSRAQLLQVIAELLVAEDPPVPGVIRITPASQRLIDPLLWRLFEYWNQKRQDRVMPSRGDIDPVDMAFVLGYVSLIDVQHAPLRFRFRLHGTELARLGGYELTGKPLDELPLPKVRSSVQESFRATVESRAPTYSFHHHMINARSVKCQLVILPLSKDENRVDMLLVGYRYPI